MAKEYGLILPNKDKPKGAIQRPSIFDDSDSEESVPTGLKKPLKKQHKLTQNKAVEEDPTVYQYDEIYDEMDQKRKESKLSRKDLDRKPKYINRLLAAADRRKRENERRIERQVQKERETEGDEFKDKEAFVTSSYKKKLEEMKEMEEQERREEYLESIGDVTKQGNLDGFYRHLYDQKVNYDDVDMKDNQEEKNKTSSRKYRKHQTSESEKSESEENQEIKKEHLPSNLDADSDFSIDSSDSEEESNQKEEKNEDNKVDQKESSDKIENPKSEDSPKTVPKEVEEISPPKKPKINIWKKRTVGEVFDAALQRYFERKAQREL